MHYYAVLRYAVCHVVYVMSVSQYRVMDVLTYRWMAAWMDGCSDGCMDAWIFLWLYLCASVCGYINGLFIKIGEVNIPSPRFSLGMWTAVYGFDPYIVVCMAQIIDPQTDAFPPPMNCGWLPDLWPRRQGEAAQGHVRCRIPRAWEIRFRRLSIFVWAFARIRHFAFNHVFWGNQFDLAVSPEFCCTQLFFWP